MGTILKFGKFKGQKLSDTPQWYQDWLLSQDWFKSNKVEARYDVIRKYTTEYGIGMGIYKEIEISNLTWDEAEAYKDMLNLYHLDETTQYYYTEPTDFLNYKK